MLGEGVSGHCLIWTSSMLPPKLRHVLECLAFSDKKFHKKKKTQRRSNHFLKIQWEIHFLTLFKYWPKLFNKKIRTEIWAFSFQICFRNQFLTLGGGQTETENTKIRVFVYLLFDHFPKSKKLFQKQIWKHKANISIQFFCWRVSVNIEKSYKKMDFSLYFQKSDLTGVGPFFGQNFFLKKPNTPQYA